MINVTAKEACQRYEKALDEGWLRQGVWNDEQDGRHVACALGVIDQSLDSPSMCPASVMPKWLARMVPNLFDGQSQEDAFAWGKAFYAELSRLNGQVPFEVVYKWHARYSWAMGIEAFKKMGRPTDALEVIQKLHERAAIGDRADRDEWYKALKNAYAYAYADAYAYGDAYANAYAYANADAYAYADANANANANTYAYAYAYANANARKKAITILANGLVECMKEVEA